MDVLMKTLILLLGCLYAAVEVRALKCWKCIAHNCDSNPEENYKASKVICHEGQRCMKVRYRMFDNVTHYDSVIRTCTDKDCEAASPDQFFSCVATPTKYMIGGCTLRSCCNDRDLCNSCGSVHLMTFILPVVACILTLLP